MVDYEKDPLEKLLKTVCDRCGDCCAAPYAVFLEEEDVERICSAANMQQEEFRRLLVDAENRLLRKIIEGIEYCIFFNEERKLCNIYEYRPNACRRFLCFGNPETAHLPWESKTAVLNSKKLAEKGVGTDGKGEQKEEDETSR